MSSQPAKSQHPNRADYADAQPVVCAKGPLLYPHIEWKTERAGHRYLNDHGVWVCANCQEPKP